MADPAALARSTRASVCAPAGYGKTHLIGTALFAGNDERQLVLTHTHAGIHALRHRLNRLEVPKSRYHLDTIAGWALQYARAFPVTTNYVKPAQLFQEDWSTIYQGVAKLLQQPQLHQVIQSTYAGAYIDEYQDCSLPQHELATAIANIIPCRVLGDPLQAIFNFKEPTVDWDYDVTTTFPSLPPLNTPHRWRHDQPFGTWLHHARLAIENDQQISLRDNLPTAIKVIPYQNPKERYQTLLRIVNQKRGPGRTVVITQWPKQCHDFAKRTPGVLVLEPIDGDDFATAVTELTAPRPEVRVKNILSFAAICHTGITQQLQERLSRAAMGTSRPRNTDYQEQIVALASVYHSNDVAPIPNALSALAKLPETRITRPELYDEVRRAITVFSDGGYHTVQDALSAIRQRTRQTGRALTQQTVGRTLLVKGLEFEHAIVIDPETFQTKQNRYVAITRGTQSLTIITNAKEL